MRRDRTGELLEDEPSEGHACAGWAGHDDDERLYPCGSCRPHLIRLRWLHGAGGGATVLQPRSRNSRLGGTSASVGVAALPTERHP